MTASVLASLLRARKVGRGRWVAKCPSHADRTPSLSIAEGKKVPVVLRCMSQGCSTASILDALGLRWSDLFWGASISPEIRGRLTDERRLERLERRFSLALFLAAIDSSKHYWRAAARRMGIERRELRDKMFPEEKAAREFQEKVGKVGWDAIWDEYWRTHDERHAAGDAVLVVRPESVHTGGVPAVPHVHVSPGGNGRSSAGA